MKLYYDFSFIKKKMGHWKQMESLDPCSHPTLCKVAPDKDSAANADNEADVQEGFHEGVFFQGHYDPVCFAWGLLLAPALHSTEPQHGFHHFGLLLRHVT